MTNLQCDQLMLAYRWLYIYQHLHPYYQPWLTVADRLMH